MLAERDVGGWVLRDIHLRDMPCHFSNTHLLLAAAVLAAHRQAPPAPATSSSSSVCSACRLR
jgi:hypothetical protein